MSLTAKAHLACCYAGLKKKEGWHSESSFSSVCHLEPCDWRWQGEGATKPMTESGSEKEGDSSGH